MNLKRIDRKTTSSLKVEISFMTKYLLLWLIMVLGLMQKSYGCLEKERIGLLEIRAFIYSQGADRFHKLASWVDDATANCCAWELVTCNSSAGHVTELSLFEFPVNNDIEQHWFLNVSLFHPFEELRTLNLSHNLFGGLSEPQGFSSLKKLEILDLSYSYLNSSTLASFSALTSLRTLVLAQNRIGRSFPDQDLSNLKKLEMLDLSSNLLSAPLLAKDLVNLRNLKMLDLSHNNFSGKLEEVWANNTSLYVLDISNNSISVRIPSPIGHCSSLNVLLMAENELEGEITAELSNLQNLEILDLSHNRLSGSVSYLNLSSLRFLYLQKNELSGSIPSTLAESSWLVVLDLRDNKFSGSIPGWINKLSKLRALLLGGNHFQGHIPIPLCQVKNVSFMDLSRNNLSRSIPPCITNLSLVDYQSSGFQMLNTMTWLLSLSPQNVYLNATIKLNQPSIDGLQLLEDEVLIEVEFRTKSNYYSYEGNILEQMTGLDLSCNELSGIIPKHIGDLQKIRALNLSHNVLSGSIPDSFSHLNQLESLDLSYKKLSGEIPSQLSEMHSLAVFNVSYNNLSGTPPSTGQFATFEENSYEGNPGLCGPLLKRGCEEVIIESPSASNEEEDAEETTVVDMEAFYGSFAASCVTILLTLSMVLCINAQWRLAWFRFINKIIY